MSSLINRRQFITATADGLALAGHAAGPDPKLRGKERKGVGS